MNLLFFPSPSHFNKWLKANHNKSTEVMVGFYKVNSGKQSITYKESVVEALCYGWIDGVRISVDEASYKIRFTPRRANSIWSDVNIKSAEELIKNGRMLSPGLEAFNKRKENKSRVYAFEQGTISLSEYEKIFRKNKKAWNFFEQQPPSYRKIAVWWVISAKLEATRLKRLDILITDSENGERIASQRRS